MNPVGAHANETSDSLAALSFPEIRGILLKACAAFPDSKVPKNWVERNELIKSFSDEVFANWHQLDRALFAIDKAQWEPLLQYLQAHESEILDRECS